MLHISTRVPTLNLRLNTPQGGTSNWNTFFSARYLCERESRKYETTVPNDPEGETSPWIDGRSVSLRRMTFIPRATPPPLAPPHTVPRQSSTLAPVKIRMLRLHVVAPSDGGRWKFASYHAREQSMPSGKLAPAVRHHGSATSVCIYRLNRSRMRVPAWAALATVSFPTLPRSMFPNVELLCPVRQPGATRNVSELRAEERESPGPAALRSPSPLARLFLQEIIALRVVSTSARGHARPFRSDSVTAHAISHYRAITGTPRLRLGYHSLTSSRA